MREGAFAEMSDSGRIGTIALGVHWTGAVMLAAGLLALDCASIGKSKNLLTVSLLLSVIGISLYFVRNSLERYAAAHRSVYKFLLGACLVFVAFVLIAGSVCVQCDGTLFVMTSSAVWIALAIALIVACCSRRKKPPPDPVFFPLGTRGDIEDKNKKKTSPPHDNFVVELEDDEDDDK